MKTGLFVPGSGEDLDSRNYKAVLGAIGSKGYEVTFVQISDVGYEVDNPKYIEAIKANIYLCYKDRPLMVERSVCKGVTAY